MALLRPRVTVFGTETKQDSVGTVKVDLGILVIKERHTVIGLNMDPLIDQRRVSLTVAIFGNPWFQYDGAGGQ